MNQFEKNITTIHKHKGRNWLNALPQKVENISSHFGITQLEEVTNLTFNYVLKGLQNGQPIVLKIYYNQKDLEKELKALRAFDSLNVVKVKGYTNDALLLECAIPGISLKTFLPKKSQAALEIACSITKNLHKKTDHTSSFPHISQWLNTIDKNWNIDVNFLTKARYLKARLLKDPCQQVLLHGDLHYDNIISNNSNWIVIDPKGVIGCSINEVWAFVQNPLLDTEHIANYFGWNVLKVRQWYFVHLIMAACWNLEDNLDPKNFLELASLIYPYS